MKAIRDHIQQIKNLCDELSVCSLFAFGSVITDKFKPDSDIDLLEQKAVRNPFLKQEIDQTKVLVYGK